MRLSPSMKKMLIGGGVVVIAALLVSGFLIWHRGSPDAGLSPKSAESATDDNQAWIEVTAQHVYRAVSQDAPSSTELFSGDQVAAGQVIFTDATGNATIHFPDGSVARLDAGTKIALDESQFSPDTGSLGVRIVLFAGNIWSKIIQLATPDSQWQVQTSNTVATVRGTAFGVSYANGTSQIIGSEHTVLVAPIDSHTQTVLEDQSMPLDQGRMIRISDARVFQIMQKRARLDAFIVTTSPTLLKEPWVVAAQKSDARIDATVEHLRGQGLDARTIRQLLHGEVIQLRQERLLDRRLILSTQTLPSVSAPRVVSSTPPVPVSQAVLPSVIRLAIQPDIASTTIFEGQRVTFNAEAIFSDGTREDVTGAAEWKVLGDIGAMVSPGVFVARLGTTTAEYGQGMGNIIAVFKNSVSGQFVLGKSSLYTVEASVVPQLGPLQG